MSLRPAADDAALREQRRLASGRLVLALYRIVKACLLYNDTNQAVLSLVPATAAAVNEFCTTREVPSARILFADHVVFVNRRVLRGSRETAAIGLELGALVERCGVNELTLERGVSQESMAGFGRVVADAQRDVSLGGALEAGRFPGIVARKVNLDDADVMPEVEASTTARVVRNYAASVLLMQQSFADFEGGDLQHGNRAKRIAQKLVALGDDDPDLLIALAASRFVDADPARLAVSTAVIVAAMTRQLTSDRVLIASVAMAALLADLGRLRLGAVPAAERIAASSLVVLSALGRFQPGSTTRTVIAYEALRLEHGPTSPGGSVPTVLSRMLNLARRFNDLRAPVDGAPPLGIDVAIEILGVAAKDALDRAYLGLLVAGLGFFALGTLVELTTGEFAVVVGAPALAIDFSKPKVQILTDPEANVLSTPLEVNLAQPARGQPERAIHRAVAANPSDLGAIQKLVMVKF